MPYTGPTNYYNPYEASREYSPMLSAGISSHSPILGTLLNVFAGDKIFPQPAGYNSAFDMMMLRSRNLDYHMMMRQGLASMQLAQRMGGIDPNNWMLNALAPTLGQPDSGLWRVISPIIGGNPVKAQMGMYADFVGQANAFSGRFGAISAAETQQLMDSLQRQFYRPANFGSYVQSVAGPLRQQLGDAGYQRLAANWSRSTIDNLEGVGFSRANGAIGGSLDSAISRIQRLNADTKLNDPDRASSISQAKQEAFDNLWKALSNSVKSPEVRQKLTQDFSKALETGDSTEFKRTWSLEKQNVFRMADRGLDILQGRIPGGIDYQLTRGFKMEDLTGALGVGLRSGMIGFHGKPTMANLGGMASMMDAARGLFGNDLSGRDLMKELNALVGIGSVDITNAADTAKMEKLLWNVKAMSRTAGISINAVKGIIEDTRNLAAQHGVLISGQAAAGIATETIGRTTAALSYMDPSYIRRMGGPVGINQAYNSGTVAAAVASPLVQQLGAMHQLAVLREGPNSATAAAIAQYAASGDVSGMGAQRFFGTVADRLGMSVHTLNAFSAYNPTLSRLGLEAAPGLREAGRRAEGTALLMEADQQFLGASGFTELAMRVSQDKRIFSLSDGAFVAEMRKWLPGASSAEIERLRQVKALAVQNQSAGKGALTSTDVLGRLGFVDFSGTHTRFIQAGGDIEFARRFNPAARTAEAAFMANVKTSAAFDARISRQMGAIHAGIGERISQAFIDGSLGPGGAEGFLSLLAGGPVTPHLIEAQKRLAEVAAAREQLGPNADPAAVSALLNKMLGGAGATGEQLIAMSNLVGMGNVQDMAKSLSAMDKSGTLMGSQRSGTEALHAFMTMAASNPAYAAHIEALTALAPSASAEKMSKAFLTLEQNRLVASAHGIISGAGGQGSGMELLRAARALAVVDPEGQLTGPLTGLSALDSAITNQKYLKIEDLVRGQARDLYGQAGILLEGNGSDAARRAALVKLYGDSGGRMLDYFQVFGKSASQNLARIAAVDDPAEQLRLAASMLGTPEDRKAAGQSAIPAGLDSPAALVEAATRYRELLGVNSGEWSQSDLIKQVVLSKQNEAKKLTGKLGRMFHGDYFWGEAVKKARDGMPSYVLGDLGILERELGGGALGANIDTLSTRLKDDKKFAAFYDKSTHKETKALLEEMMQRTAAVAATEEDSGKDPQAELSTGLNGVMEAIRSLVEAVRDATKTP